MASDRHAKATTIRPGVTRVLLVEDDATTRAILERIVSVRGYRVTAVASAEAALAELEREGFDVVMLDLELPGAHGHALIRSLRAMDPAPEMIVVSGTASMDDAIEALRHQVADFVRKPFRAENVSDAIERALGLRRQRQKPTVASLQPGDPLAGLSKAELDRLSPRETQLLRAFATGARSTTLARELSISPHTVRNHLKSIFAKLSVSSQAELMERLKQGSP